MTQVSCITDLFNYEKDRADHIQSCGGSIEGFTTKHGMLLQRELEGNKALTAHLVMPDSIKGIELASGVRKALGQSLDTPLPPSKPISSDDVSKARSFVRDLLGQDLSDVAVIHASARVMRDTSFGTVYSCGPTNHLIVVPESHFDPVGLLVHQFAIAAHYTAMRKGSAIGSMVSDSVTQSMIGHYASLQWFCQNDRSLLLPHLRNMVRWEFATGLGRTATYPMGFIVSDLGVSLLKDFGGEMFRSIVSELYESMPDGRAMWFGTNSFIGCALALIFFDCPGGIRKFISLDTGDKTLQEKLELAGLEVGAQPVESCNKALMSMIDSSESARIQ